MAMLIEFSCTDCSYSSGPLRYGSMPEYPVLVVPALNTQTNEIEEAFFVDSINPDLVLYTHDQLHDKSKGSASTSMDMFSLDQLHELSLPREGNFCPSCNGFTLNTTCLAMID